MTYLRVYFIISVVVYLVHADGTEVAIRQSKNEKCYPDSRSFIARIRHAFVDRLCRKRTESPAPLDARHCNADPGYFSIRFIYDKLLLIGNITIGQNQIFEDASKLMRKVYNRLLQEFNYTHTFQSSAQTKTSCARNGPKKSLNLYFD